MALNSIGDDAPAVTEHAHHYYMDHSLPTPEPSGAGFPFTADQQRSGGNGNPSSPRAPLQLKSATPSKDEEEEEEEEIFEEIGPGNSQGLSPDSTQDGNIESLFQSTGTVYV